MGEYAKQKGVDELYCTGPLSKETSDGFNGKWYETKDEIYEAVKPLLDQDCIVFLHFQDLTYPIKWRYVFAQAIPSMYR